MSGPAALSFVVIRPLPNGLLAELNTREIDEDQASPLRDELLAAAVTAPGRALYLNFSRVRLVSRTFWQKLVAMHSDLRQQGRRLVVLNLAPGLKEQFHDVERTALAETDTLHD